MSTREIMDRVPDAEDAQIPPLGGLAYLLVLPVVVGVVLLLTQ